MALVASGVNINPDLSKSLGSIGTNANSAIASNYAAAKQKLANGATALGRNGAATVSPTSYGGQRLATTQGLDTGNLEAALGGGLGNTAYQDTLAQRDFGQQEQLANEAAQLNKPSLLDQIFQGIGAVGGAGAKIYGAANKIPTFGNSGSGSGELPSNLSLIPGGSASAYYSNPYGGGY